MNEMYLSLLPSISSIPTPQFQLLYLIHIISECYLWRNTILYNRIHWILFRPFNVELDDDHEC